MRDKLIPFKILMKKARIRFPDKIITPLPHKKWFECIYKDEGFWMLHFHIDNDHSSKAVHMEA